MVYLGYEVMCRPVAVDFKVHSSEIDARVELRHREAGPPEPVFEALLRVAADESWGIAYLLDRLRQGSSASLALVRKQHSTKGRY